MENTSELLENIENTISQKSDIHHAIEHFFKDDSYKKRIGNEVDLRSRLIGKAVKGHSIISYFQSIVIAEAQNKSLAEGLDVLSLSLKRHVISLTGKSRSELIELFKANAETLKQNSNFNLFGQMPK